MTLTYDLYAIGNALVDLEYRVDDDFLQQHGIEKGLMTLAEPAVQQSLIRQLEQQHPRLQQASGGSAANSILAAAAFGARCFYNGRVAADTLGQFYRQDLEAAGIACPPPPADADLPTGTCVVMVTPDTERTMNTYLGISATLTADDIDHQALQQSRWLYVEGYLCTSDSARAAVAQARLSARRTGTQIAMTFSDPAMVTYFKPQLTEMLADGVDLLFCNEDEALGFTGCATLDDAIARLRNVAQRGLVTIGARGAVAWTQDGQVLVPGRQVVAVDTLGAGDSFAGATLYGLTRGWSLQASAELGIRTAATVVSQFGPRLALPQYATLLEEMA